MSLFFHLTSLARAEILTKNFVGFLVYLKTPKGHFEINWPLLVPVPKGDNLLPTQNLMCKHFWKILKTYTKRRHSYFYLFSLMWHFTLHHKFKVDTNEFINLSYMSLSVQFFDQSLSRCLKSVLFNKIAGSIRCSQVPKMNIEFRFTIF